MIMTENFAQLSCELFVDVLSTKKPVPGGGGASALAGALGTALGNMVGDLTLGKKRYAAVQEDIRELMKQASALQKRLLELVNADAAAFAPLAAAYGLPSVTEAERASKAEVMEKCLRDASAVPLEMMECCCQAILLHRDFAEKGSVIAVSDAGVGVSLCRAALVGASLNVRINTRAMADREYAEDLNRKIDDMLAEYLPIADQVCQGVTERLSKPPKKKG